MTATRRLSASKMRKKQCSADAPDRVLHALARGGVDAVVIAAHGRLMPGLSHYLELGSDGILTPAEMFDFDSTQIVGTLACWSARVSWPEQRRPVDPRYHRAGQRNPGRFWSPDGQPRGRRPT
jgi:hypothetical protein